MGKGELRTIFYEKRMPSRRRIKKSISELSSIERRTYGILKEVSLTVGKEEIPGVIQGNYSDIVSKVRKRTVENKNGSIRYDSGNGIKVFKKGQFDSVASFVEYKVKIIADHQISILQSIADFDTVPNFPRRDRKGRRLYQLLTNLDSSLLRYIQIDNQPLFEIDLKNSQWVFLSIILSKTLDSIGFDNEGFARAFINTLIESTFPPTLQSPSFPQSTTLPPYLCSGIEGIPMPDDIKSIIESSFNGEVYKTIGGKLLEKENLTSSERDTVKDICFLILFGDYRHSDGSDLKKKFNQSFPQFIKAIDGIKEHCGGLYSKGDPLLKENGLDFHSLRYQMPETDYEKAGSNLLSILLQRFE
jgi:hypothetical protein